MPLDSLLDKGFSQFSESRTKDSKDRHSVSKDHFENKIDISLILKDRTLTQLHHIFNEDSTLYSFAATNHM